MVRIFALAAGLTVPVSFAHAQDTERGRLLYQNHCQECHETGVHFREERKVTNPEELTAQVVRWTKELELDWTQEEVADVRAFLDERFYRLEK